MAGAWPCALAMAAPIGLFKVPRAITTLSFWWV
jgi:hypothetical protein